MEVKDLQRSKKEIVNDDDDELNTTNLYEVNTDKLVANVLEHQNTNVLDPSIPNRNRSKKIRSAWLHNLPAVEGQSPIEKAPSPKIKMKFGNALKRERDAAAAAAAMRRNAMKPPNQSPNGPPVNTRATKKGNTKNSSSAGGRRTRRRRFTAGPGLTVRRRRPSKASRKI
jgi:hypothetical protein